MVVLNWFKFSSIIAINFSLLSLWSADIKIFEISLETILIRGKTKIGDKTIADTINFIIKNLKLNKDYPTVFKTATKEALDEFKGKKIKIGRARMFEDKTRNLDDPGMFALNRLTEIF